MEDDPDVAGVAGEVGGKVGPAGLGHQGGPVPLRDGQVVVAAAGVRLHIKGGEGDGYEEPWAHHDGVGPVEVTRVVGGVAGGGEDTWGVAIVH